MSIAGAYHVFFKTRRLNISVQTRVFDDRSLDVVYRAIEERLFGPISYKNWFISVTDDPASSRAMLFHLRGSHYMRSFDNFKTLGAALGEIDGQPYSLL